MRNALRFALLAAVLVSVAGCRFKGFESFSKATSSRGEESKEFNFGESAKANDPRREWGKYSGGGIAEANGGLNTQTRYGLGAQKDGKVMQGFDQPTKGTGQLPGEYSGGSAAGHGQSNAPAFQPEPGSAIR
jgi:hypothetical protein